MIKFKFDDKKDIENKIHNGYVNQEDPEETMLGARSKYIATENKDYQPRNSNVGIIKGSDKKIRDKKERYGKLAERSLESLAETVKTI